MIKPSQNAMPMPCPNGCHCGRSPKAFACQVHCGIKISSSFPCILASSISTIMLIRQVSQRFQMKPHPHSIECRQQFLCAVVVQSHELIPSTPAAKCPSPAAFVSDTTLPKKKTNKLFLGRVWSAVPDDIWTAHPSITTYLTHWPSFASEGHKWWLPRSGLN